MSCTLSVPLHLMIITVSFMHKVSSAEKATMVFPDSESLYLPDTTGEEAVLKHSTLLFEATKLMAMYDIAQFLPNLVEESAPNGIYKKLNRAYTPEDIERILGEISKLPLTKEAQIVGNEEPLVAPVTALSLKDTSAIKIIAGYRKNAIISEYHSEEYFHGIERLVPGNLTDSQLVYEQIRLNAICEKAVLAEMRIDDLINDNLVTTRLEQIKIKLGKLK